MSKAEAPKTVDIPAHINRASLGGSESGFVVLEGSAVVSGPLTIWTHKNTIEVSKQVLVKGGELKARVKAKVVEQLKGGYLKVEIESNNQTETLIIDQNKIAKQTN